MPTRRYSAYLVRHWSLPGGTERIEIQHIQSGETARVPTFQAALDWMGHQGQEPATEHASHDPEGTANGTTLGVAGAGPRAGLQTE